MQEALRDAQSLAVEYGQQELNPAHLLLAILKQTDGVAAPLFDKLGVSEATVQTEMLAWLNRQPKVSGGGGSLRLSREFTEAMNAAEKEMRVG